MSVTSALKRHVATPQLAMQGQVLLHTPYPHWHKNTSSRGTSNTLAIRKASAKDSPLSPLSKATMVLRDTPTFSANCCWVISQAKKRRVRILLVIVCSCGCWFIILLRLSMHKVHYMLLNVIFTSLFSRNYPSFACAQAKLGAPILQRMPNKKRA